MVKLLSLLCSSTARRSRQGLALHDTVRDAKRLASSRSLGAHFEYIFGRESKDFGDIARPIAAGIKHTFSNGRITGRADGYLAKALRATVIGASQFLLSRAVKRFISQIARIAATQRARGVPYLNLQRSLMRTQSLPHSLGNQRFCTDESQHSPLASLAWRPHHHRLHALAKGIAESLGSRASRLPLVLMTDGDIGKLLGHLLQHELSVDRDIVSIDSIQLQEFDYLDIGEVIMPANVVPVCDQVTPVFATVISNTPCAPS